MRRINLFLIRNQGGMTKKLTQKMQHALENSLINLKNIYNLHKKGKIVHKLQTADFRIKLSLLHLEQFWVLLKMQSNYTECLLRSNAKFRGFTSYFITRILSDILINANLRHSTLIYLALINAACKFSRHEFILTWENET